MDFRESGSLRPWAIGVLFEICQMVGLDPISSTESSYLFGVADINPSLLQPQSNGAQQFNLLGLDQISEEDKFFFGAMA